MKKTKTTKRLRVTFEVTVEECAPLDMLGDGVAALLKDSGFSRRAVASVTLVDLDALAAATDN